MKKEKLIELIKEVLEEELLDENGKKDACYHKVKAAYDVWPSAYASGALVKCRKVGAANWGKSKKKEESLREEFQTHDMYNPKTGEKFVAKKDQDHKDMAAKGYVHVDPKKIEKVLRDEGGASGMDPFLKEFGKEMEEEIIKALEAMPNVGQHKDKDYILHDDEEVKIVKETKKKSGVLNINGLSIVVTPKDSHKKRTVLEEKNAKRVPRKKGQPAKSDKHSDLYTDEDPKGTIHGLGFKDEAKARASVSKIKKSSRSHAHKTQAAIAMEQRAKAAGKSKEAAIFRKFIEQQKKKTKAKNKNESMQLQERCQKGYKTHDTQKTKKMFGNTYRNCVKAEEGQLDEEGLRDWFDDKDGDGQKGWEQIGGKYDGKPCAKQPGQKTKPKCASPEKAASMSKKERDNAAKRKRKKDPNPNRKGKAKNVNTDPKKGRKKKNEELNMREGFLYEGDDAILEIFKGATLDEGGLVCEACLFETLQEASCGCPDLVAEAEYRGRKVKLNKPMRGDVKKFKVFVKDPKTGNVKKVNFGDPNMRIKKSNPKRRKSFRARHNCDNPGPKTKARYWSCRKW